MAISKDEFDAAVARGEEAKAHGVAVKAAVKRGDLEVVLDTGVRIAVPVRLLQELSTANGPEAFGDIEISPSGLGLYFPHLDADVDVPALFSGVYGSKKWMAAIMGRAGGKRATSAKSEAARRNGLKGGRPRKVAAPQMKPSHA